MDKIEQEFIKEFVVIEDNEQQGYPATNQWNENGTPANVGQFISSRLNALVMENLGGIQIIAKERQEQVEKHGFTIEHDQQHMVGELVGAAMFTLTKISSYYPSWWDERYKVKLSNKTGVEALKVAGAYLAAEIDRLIEKEKRAQISA